MRKVLALTGALLLSSAAQAQNVAEGAKIAQTWCSGCHQIEPGARTASDVTPSFSSVAQMSSTTETSLAVFLSSPHQHMPDYSLSRSEIRDVSAYILSLRKAR